MKRSAPSWLHDARFDLPAWNRELESFVRRLNWLEQPTASDIAAFRAVREKHDRLMLRILRHLAYPEGPKIYETSSNGKAEDDRARDQLSLRQNSEKNGVSRVGACSGFGGVLAKTRK